MTVDLLVVYPHEATFIDQDIQILRKHFSVSTLEYRARRDRIRLVSLVVRARVVVAWFVLGYAYAVARLAPLRNVKTLMIPGGWDVEALPALGYGAMLSPRAAGRTSYALAKANRVLAVSAYTLSRVRSYAPAARADVLYHGFDADRFIPSDSSPEGVLTVARVAKDTWRLKGLDVFAEVARRMPDVPFTIIGKLDPAIHEAISLPANVTCMGQVTQGRLIQAYRSAKVYAQLSAVESFSCSTAEAMLCGCAPVTTSGGALPEVVGDAGLTVPYGDVNAASDAVERALRSDGGWKARERIRRLFPLQLRESRLVEETRRLLGESA